MPASFSRDVSWANAEPGTVAFYLRHSCMTGEGRNLQDRTASVPVRAATRAWNQLISARPLRHLRLRRRQILVRNTLPDTCWLPTHVPNA